MANSEEHSPLTWAFEWDRGYGEVAALGGMLGPVTFRLKNDQEFQPFAIAPWADESGSADGLPGILQRLRGEWPCVPFGMPEPPAGLPKEWQAVDDTDSGFHLDPHGVSSNDEWKLCEHFGTGVLIEFVYPDTHPVERIVRKVEGREGEAAIDLELEIHMRRDENLPVGLHPVFTLPERSGAVELHLSAKSATAYPVETESGVSRLLPEATSSDLTKMPRVGGMPVDITNLPLAGQTEELVQVAVNTGKARLNYRDVGFSVELLWNAAQFPFCLLWISNGGRSASPWNNRHYGLGIEPVASLFDLGIGPSRSERHPLTSFGHTTLGLRRSSPFKTVYSISVEAA